MDIIKKAKDFINKHKAPAYPPKTRPGYKWDVFGLEEYERKINPSDKEYKQMIAPSDKEYRKVATPRKKSTTR